MRHKSKGFTLIEMVFVIVVVSILSSVAIPRMSDASSSARKAVVYDTARAVRTSAEYMRGLYLMQKEKTGYIEIPGGKVYVVRGYPTSESIAHAAGILEIDFVVETQGNTTKIYPRGVVDHTDCVIIYKAANTDGFLTIPPEIKIHDRSC